MEKLESLERLVDARQYQKALAIYRSHQAPEGWEAKWHYTGALAFHYAGDLYNARFAVERSLSESPDDDLRLLARFRLGLLAQELGDTYIAIEQLSSIVTDASGSDDIRSMMIGVVWFNLGHARFQRREYVDSAECYRMAVDLFRSDSLHAYLCQAIQNLAWVLALIGEPHEALTALEEAEGIARDDSRAIWKNRLTRAHILRLMGSYNDAVHIAHQVIESADVSYELKGIAAWVAGCAALELGMVANARQMADVASEWAIVGQDTMLMGLAQELRTNCIQTKERGA